MAYNSIKLWQHDNPLTANPNDLIGRVMTEGSLSISQICDSAVARGGADIPAKTMEHAVITWFDEAAYQLCNGFAVNAGLFTAAPVFRGTFDSPKEPYDPAKHRVLVEFQQGATLRRQLANVQVTVLGIAESAIFIAQVEDMKTHSQNDLLTPGRNLRITGGKIKILGENSANGVYFVAEADGARTKVDASDVVTNNPSELMIVIPDLAAGAYKLEVTTQFSTGGGQLLKEPRTAKLDKVLTVQA